MADIRPQDVSAEINQQNLKTILHYDPETGIFKWRVKPSKRVNIGAIAGSLNDEGYCRIVIDKKSWRAHRLAWLYMHGYLPSLPVDHIDGNKANNALSNLRLVSTELNQQNQRRAKAGNASGYLGVQKRSDAATYRAVIRVGGVRHVLGTFKTPEEAHQAYLKAKRELHAGCTI